MSCPVCQGYNSDKCPCCSEGVKGVMCADCQGTGIAPWTAVDVKTFEIKVVSKEEWIAMPDDECEANAVGSRFYRYEEGGGKCMTCYGDGKLIVD